MSLSRTEESVQECRKCTKLQKVYKSAENAGLLGDVAALNIILTKQPNSYALCPKL